MESLDVNDEENQNICDHFKNYHQVKNVLKTTFYLYLEPLQHLIMTYLQNVVYLKSDNENEDNNVFVCYIPYLNFHSLILEMKTNLVKDCILQLPISNQLLEMFVEYVHSHGLFHGHEIEKPLKSKNLNDCLQCKWDAWFANRFDLFPNQVLYDLILFANQINVHALLHLLSAKVAAKIRGKPTEHINNLLDVNKIDGGNIIINAPQCDCGRHAKHQV